MFGINSDMVLGSEITRPLLESNVRFKPVLELAFDVKLLMRSPLTTAESILAVCDNAHLFRSSYRYSEVTLRLTTSGGGSVP